MNPNPTPVDDATGQTAPDPLLTGTSLGRAPNPAGTGSGAASGYPAGPDEAAHQGHAAAAAALAAAAGAATFLAVGDTEAHAAPRGVPARKMPKRTRGKVPTPAELHILERFTGGWNPTLLPEIRRRGINRWFANQLAPNGKIGDGYFHASRKWWPCLSMNPTQLWRRSQNEIEPLWVVSANYERWVLMRRIYSKRQVQETMAAFWENHFHVPVHADGVAVFRVDYGLKLRKHALGKFEDLLYTAITHPAMGLYLSNIYSTKHAPNENLGRELLELHTLGVGSGYTEQDVKNSARILTGYRVDAWSTWKSYYEPKYHYTGPVKVLGFRHANTKPDGRAVVRAYLKYLAHHPATARHIARKLAVRFVKDNPSNALVNHLAAVYRANDTRIAPVLKAIINHPEFKKSRGYKVRTPDEDVVATCRALRVNISKPTKDNHAANSLLWTTTSIGLAPFGWPRPDGRPDTVGAWTSVSRMLSSFSVHYSMAGGWWPTGRIKYPQPRWWLPNKRCRFDYFVDHLSRKILGKPASQTLITACCQATGLYRSAIITPDHALIRWNMPRLLSTLLDSPDFFRR